MVGYYSEYKNTEDIENTRNNGKKKNFKLSGNLKDKIYDIFETIREKSNIDNINYAYNSPTTGDEYLKTILSKKTLLEKDDSRTIPSKNTKYSCNVLLRIQSVFHSTKDKDKDVEYYSQVLLEQCCYDFFIGTRKIDHRNIIRTGITCKKIPCYMRDSACRWFIVKNAKIF